ncbi:MAG: DUF3883 domain-containing protein [Sphingomonas adhaesiva]|uniref:protein NO VEIN domain-containing protein n=1 Tax=Sphingomonas adhaesiva TaxID=28212 RepID=UPI002FF96917
MRELPSRGRCHAAFLLASVARLKKQGDVEEWLAAALSGASYMAGALDLAGTVGVLVGGGLAGCGDTVWIRKDLARLSHVADRSSFLGIASLLLRRFPPDWIGLVVSDGEVMLDLIPPKDLSRLEWLGPDLVPLILNVHAQITAQADDDLRKLLGTAGELAVMDALRRVGLHPVHVALVSDAYGYDIEVVEDGKTRRLEVKTCVPSTADRIIISRNEFAKAMSFEKGWELVQVTLTSAVIVAGRVEAKDVLRFRGLESKSIVDAAPAKSETFDWLESAELRPLADSWRPSGLAVSDKFSVVLAEL